MDARDAQWDILREMSCWVLGCTRCFREMASINMAKWFRVCNEQEG